jgi:hypothetical protein
MMNIYKCFPILFIALILASAIPTVVTAASIEITTSIKSSLDKTIAGAESTQADKINSLYNELLTLQEQEQDWDVKINSLHTGNKETLNMLNKQIKQIDEANLDKLEADVTLARERYKPLFSHYSTLNKQIETARSLNNKELSAVLRFQANVLKIPVKLAHMDIETKEKARKEAKNSATKTMKKIRSNLADINPDNMQIKAKQSAIKTIETGITPVWNTFKQGTKKGDSKSVLDTLASLTSLLRQINEEKQKVFNLETKISNILSTAKEQIQ